jgi:putative membrane protein
MTLTLTRHLARGCLAGAFALAAFAASAADETFVQKAGQGGAAEVAAGNLAKAKGQSDAVKQFGAQMVTDHTRANDELKSIASGKNMSVPAAPDEKHQKALSKLEGMSGADFDRAFKKQMVDDHQATIKLFEQQARSGKDADLKGFAAKTLPDLKHHLEMAKALK